MVRNIPQFLIAAPTSGSGKTTISRGLMALFVKKGLKVQPFKCGPDYIDTKYHTDVCGRPSVNLDTFMASKEHVCKLYARYSSDADISIVEGMMGMFDGYDRDSGSSAEVAQVLGIPVVLVVDAKSAAYSIAPLLSGFIHFRPEIRIAGVIFNRVGSKSHYQILQGVCEELNITCLGYLPKHKNLEQESRHLGLDFNRSNGTDALDLLTNLLEENINWQLLLQTTTASLQEKEEPHLQSIGKMNILVARNEESFSFIYEEHLDILRRMGTVTFFNPEHNCPISEKTDLLYLPGGYPEERVEELSKATLAKDSICKYIEAGGKVLAECGGMIYLSKAISYDTFKSSNDCSGFEPMVGIFPFYISNERGCRKLRLGYRQFHYNGQHLRGHEFHYTSIGRMRNLKDSDDRFFYHRPPSIAQVYKANGEPVGTRVFRYKNVIASYIHLYWGETDLMSLF